MLGGGSGSGGGSPLSSLLSLVESGISYGVKSLFGGSSGSDTGSDTVPETAPGGALGEPEALSLAEYGVDQNSSSNVPGEQGFENPFFLGVNDTEFGSGLGFSLTGEQTPQLYDAPDGGVYSWTNESNNAENELQTDFNLGGGYDAADEGNILDSTLPSGTVDPLSTGSLNWDGTDNGASDFGGGGDF